MIVDIAMMEEGHLQGKEDFFVDANVLVLIYGPLFSPPEQRRAAVYSNFVQNLKYMGCALKVSAINIQELFHVIERQYWKRYQQQNTAIKLKDYRNIAAERGKVSQAQASIWIQIKSFYDIVSETIDNTDLEGFINFYHTHRYEPFDFIVASHHKPCNIITEDQDFSYDNDIAVFTVI